MGIRIQPRDLEVPDEEPFLHDRLDRETPARVLTQIVASVEGPCVLSIDGPFGAGKSTFLRLWTQHLKNKRLSRRAAERVGDRLQRRPLPRSGRGHSSGARVTRWRGHRDPFQGVSRCRRARGGAGRPRTH